MRLHVLLDANVVAAHYIPKTTSSQSLSAYSRALLTGKSLWVNPCFLIPNFCIAEVFAVFEKYRWGKSWNPQVTKQNCITQDEFEGARVSFHSAIHNASQIMQYDLSRYHILCSDLIAPINAAYQIRRAPKNNSTSRQHKRISIAKTYDLLIVAMGIWLQKQYGEDNFVMVTGDRRIKEIVDRAKAASLGRDMKAHLTKAASTVGLKYGPGIYPTVIDLTHASKKELGRHFNGWQLYPSHNFDHVLSVFP